MACTAIKTAELAPYSIGENNSQSALLINLGPPFLLSPLCSWSSVNAEDTSRCPASLNAMNETCCILL